VYRIYRWVGIKAQHADTNLEDKKMRKAKQQIILRGNPEGKIYLNCMEVSLFLFGTSFSRLLTYKQYFASMCTLL